MAKSNKAMAQGKPCTLPVANRRWLKFKLKEGHEECYPTRLSPSDNWVWVILEKVVHDLQKELNQKSQQTQRAFETLGLYDYFGVVQIYLPKNKNSRTPWEANTHRWFPYILFVTRKRIFLRDDGFHLRDGSNR